MDHSKGTPFKGDVGFYCHKVWIGEGVAHQALKATEAQRVRCALVDALRTDGTHKGATKGDASAIHIVGRSWEP